MRIRTINKTIHLIFAIFCFSLLGCSKSTPEDISNCTNGYPKVFGNENILESKIDVYYYNSGNLTYARSIYYDLDSINHEVTLINQSSLSETNFFMTFDYELLNGCIVDNRNYQKMKINENCTIITIDYLAIGINGGIWITGIFECDKTNQMVIEEGINYFEQSSQEFDSIYVDRVRRELTIVN